MMNPITFGDQTHWQFELFNSIKSVRHLVTGSNIHIQRGTILGLNYGLNVPDIKSTVLHNRTELLNHLDIQLGSVSIPNQTHSCNIEVVTEQNKTSSFENVDALITNVPNILIGVLSADCVPILLVDPVKNVVASIHAGWRGTVAEIVKATIRHMCTQFGCKAQNIFAGIGPSISAENYEVGEDVAKNFRNVCVQAMSNNKSCIDLWLENKIQLIEMGVEENNISISGQCTFANKETFYSARRDGIATGRIVSVIGLVT